MHDNSSATLAPAPMLETDTRHTRRYEDTDDYIWDQLRAVQRSYQDKGFETFAIDIARADRRGYPRVDCTGLRGTLWYHGDSLEIVAIDLSMSGVRESGDVEHIQSGSEVVLALELDKESAVVLACNVIRVAGSEVSLRVMALNPMQVKALASFLFSHEFMIARS